MKHSQDTTDPAGMTDEELLASLDDASADRGNEWAPEVGDRILGRLVRVEHPEVKSGNRKGQVLPVLILETADGELRVAVKHDILRDELLGKETQIGDRVAILYAGQPEGKRYYRYVVRVAFGGPRDPSLAFAVEPPAEDLGLTTEAEAGAGTEGSPSW